MIDSHQDWRGLLAITAPLGYERPQSEERGEKREQVNDDARVSDGAHCLKVGGF